MTDGRKRISRVRATLCIAAVSGSMFVAAPTHAEPDIDTVQSRVDKLYHQAEQASERYNDARIEVTQARSRLTTLESRLARERAKVNTVRAQVASAVVAQYQGQALSSTTQVLLSDNPDDFLDQLTTVAAFNDQRTQLMADFAVQAGRLEKRQEAAEREVARIAATTKQLGKEKAEIDANATEAERLLDTLEERAAAREASRAEARAEARSQTETASPTSPTSSAAPAAPAPSAPASGRGAAAVRYAMAQVDKSYVYGAAGPSSFDCSGLTMMAWAQAGVSLPHSSGAQMGSGTPVSQSELQPGDLVFYYSPVSHVGMYIGNGQIVNALNPSSGIAVSELNSMPYAGAVRPG